MTGIYWIVARSNNERVSNYEVVTGSLFQYVNFNDNPFIWDGSADNVRSSVVSLSFKFPNGSSPYQGTNK